MYLYYFADLLGIVVLSLMLFNTIELLLNF